MQKALLLASSVLMAFASSAAVPLVKDGKAVSEIVLVEGTSLAAKWAVADFQDHVKKMTGATLPVVTDPTLVAAGWKTYAKGSEICLKCSHGFSIIVR